MTENNESGNKKTNFADLSKIPANEFEKHFHEWMERDDVARGLQAKLRCDLIKNFNKTNLGKQIQAHSMCSTGGSTYRLSMTPLVLALNTLVAEFLYSQNCHFTLSVFCTEIPFRNTLPDFESMRHYRFSEQEINEIWEAVTGAAANKHSLDPIILDEYEGDSNNSLLLLILKCLVNMKPQEMLRKSVEIQTEGNPSCKEKCSASVQANIPPPPSPTKSSGKSNDNLKHLNKYLLVLSQKVNEMTHEFELLVKQRNLQKPKSKKTPRSREFHSLNRSLDRINENVKQLTKSKRKGKRLTNIMESIDSLTKQFGKCAASFGEVTRELTKKETKQHSARLEQSLPKDNLKETQTETGLTDKSYSDWIYEMRSTENGKKFLERIESSLTKAVAKHKEQWQSEQEAKIKHMKSLLKLRYKQKMLIQLSRQGSEEQAMEAHKLSENIEMRLKNFETKQFELLEKLRESSFELQEAQKQIQKSAEYSKRETPERKEKTNSPMDKTKRLQKQHSQMIADNDDENGEITPETSKAKQIIDIPLSENPNHTVNNNAELQLQLNETKNVVITPRDLNVEKIINETKLRLQQLESESNCLEKHFQVYLERRNRENKYRQEATNQLIAQSQSKTSEILRSIEKTQHLNDSGVGKIDLTDVRTKSKFPIEDDLVLDEEFARLKDKLALTQSRVEMTTTKSLIRSPSLEIKNAIREAKDKFFENEFNFRQQKENQLKQKCSGIKNQKEPLTHPQTVLSPRLAKDKKIVESPVKNMEKDQINIFNISTMAVNDEEKLSAAEPTIPNDTKAIEKVPNSNNELKKSPRRELFPKTPATELTNLNTTTHLSDSLTPVTKDLRQTLNDLKTYTENMESKEEKSTESSEDLIKQSMAKMKQLFEDKTGTSKQAGILEMYNSDTDDDINSIPHRDGDALEQKPSDLNLTSSSNTTTTNIATITTSSSTLNSVAKRQLHMLESITIRPTSNFANMQYDSAYNEGDLEKTFPKLNRISMPSALNVASATEDSSHSENNENDILDEEISDNSSLGQISDRNEKFIPDLQIISKRDSLEVGEVLSDASRPVFIPVSQMSNSVSSSSNSSDSDFDNALLKKNDNNTKIKTSDESDDDFWA
ncbi:uncoordinated [Haematobia irritans]|uniref:uncoordinated n=1 Tax=Haematobia irritans TaxID=7368 RepID=UPI003F4FA64A